MVTVTYNSDEVLVLFLKSVALLQSRSSVHAELLIVDNNSGQPTLNTLKQAEQERHRWLHVIRNDENLGVAKANNIGIEYARCHDFTHVLLVNNDTELPSDLLEVLCRDAVRAGAALISPVIVEMGDRESVWYGGGHVRLLRGFRAVHYRQVPCDVSTTKYASTCCLLVSCSVFDEVGTMDETYFVYWDDVDFIIRALRHGQVLAVTPNTIVAHAAGSLTGGNLSAFTIWHSSFGRGVIMGKEESVWRRLMHRLYWRSWLVVRMVMAKDSVPVGIVRARAFRLGWRAGVQSRLEGVP